MANDQKNDSKDEKSVDLEQLLAELGGGIRMTIHRLEPLWCDGYLGTLEVSDDDAISLDNLRELFGGRKLKCKILDDKGKIIAVRTAKFPDPPREDGRVLKQPDSNKEDESGGGGNSLLALFMKSQEAMSKTQAQHQKAISDMSQKQNETIQNILMDRIKENSDHGSNGSGSKTPQESLKEAAELVEFLEGLRSRIKGDEETANPVTSDLMDMAKTFFEFKLDQEKSKFEQQIKQQQSESARTLPDREKKKSAESKPAAEQISDEDLLTEAVSRFHEMPTAKQRVVAEMFFRKQTAKAEPVTSSANNEDELESKENNGDTENEGYTDSNDQIEMDPDDEDELDAVESETKETPTA
jgi:hypothetical protein